MKTMHQNRLENNDIDGLGNKRKILAIILSIIMCVSIMMGIWIATSNTFFEKVAEYVNTYNSQSDKMESSTSKDEKLFKLLKQMYVFYQGLDDEMKALLSQMFPSSPKLHDEAL